MLNLRNVSAYKKQALKSHKQYKERGLPERDFQVLGDKMIKYRTHEQGVFVDIESLEFDGLYKLHYIYIWIITVLTNAQPIL